MYKSNLEQLKGFVRELKERYNFQGPLHYTDFTNLNDIFECGYLKSRWHCEQDGIAFRDVAEHLVLDRTLEGVKKCVRFHYKEKTPDFFNVEGILPKNQNPHLPIPVYLLFNEELIYLDTTLFIDCNAGSIYSRIGNDYDFFSNIDWPKVFHRNSLFGYDEFIRNEIIRKRCAELLSKEPVSLDYLNKIIFRSEADKQRANNLFGLDSRYEVNKEFFNNGKCYIDKYRLETLNDNSSKDIRLHWSFNIGYPDFTNYEHHCKIISTTGEVLWSTNFTFKNASTDWNFTFTELPKESSKLEYLIDDVLCIEEFF